MVVRQAPGWGLGRGSAAALEPPAVVAGLDDLAVVRKSVEQYGGHLGVGERAGPLAEREVGCDDDRCAFVGPADQMEQQLAASLGERQITELIQHDEVQAGQIVGQPSLPTGAGLRFEPVGKVDRVEEPTAR